MFCSFSYCKDSERCFSVKSLMIIKFYSAIKTTYSDPSPPLLLALSYPYSAGFMQKDSRFAHLFCSPNIIYIIKTLQYCVFCRLFCIFAKIIE